MPHFRNFHSTTYYADTIEGKKVDDMIIDEETITADKYDDFIDLGTGNDTIDVRGLDDEIYFNDELTTLVEEGTDTLLLKGGTGNDTINATDPEDNLFDPYKAGATPPLELSYVVTDLDEMGATPIDALSYTLDV